jgi:hypothetical protein
MKPDSSRTTAPTSSTKKTKKSAGADSTR